MFEIEVLPLLTDNYAYILVDESRSCAAVVDPSEAAPVLAHLQKRGLKLEIILNTHHHADHVAGNLELKQATGAQVWAPNDARIPGVDRVLREGERYEIFSEAFEALHAPGHARTQHLIYFRQRHTLFCGDVLFGLGAGRFFEGTPDEALVGFRKISAMPDETLLYWGHEYTLKNLAWVQSLGPSSAALEAHARWALAQRQKQLPTLPGLLSLERVLNPFLRSNEAAEVARLRASRSAFRSE
jgi:hydroxyacylglutathione hydrolase